MLCCTIPIKTVSEMNARGHWAIRAKRTKLHRTTAYAMLLSYGKAKDLYRIAAPVRFTITLTRLGGRTLDDDNLRSALKATRDGVADWLGIDDGDKRLTWLYGQEPKQRKMPPGVRVEIVAIVDAADVFPWVKGRAK
jgi:hypothetical protein